MQKMIGCIFQIDKCIKNYENALAFDELSIYIHEQIHTLSLIVIHWS